MSNQNAIQDDNQNFALIAHSGTAVGTAVSALETRQVMASNGNMHVDLKAGTVSVSGTTNTIITGGTINVLEVGTVAANILSGTINAGTTSISGTVPVRMIDGTLTALQGGTINTGTISFTPFSIRIDPGTVSGTITTYVGKANPGSNEGSAVWQIRRSIEVSGQGTITWADGNGNFDNVWTGHGTLSYS